MKMRRLFASPKRLFSRALTAPDRFEQECGLGKASRGHTVLQCSCSYLQPGSVVVWPGG